MSATNSSLSAQQSDEKRPHPEYLEIDRFVDHFLNMMCDRSRRQILELLAVPNKEELDSHVELRSGEIAKTLDLSPATISGHLRQLSEAGLIISRREGNAIYYRLSNYLLVRAFQDLLIALNNEHNIRLNKLTS